jgi:hypothetical protein
MSHLPPSLHNHVEAFVRDIKVDEIKDEQERLKQHLGEIQKEIALTLKSLHVQASPQTSNAPSPSRSNYRYTVPLWLFTLVGLWAIATTLAVGLVLGDRLPQEGLRPNGGQIEYRVAS